MPQSVKVAVDRIRRPLDNIMTKFMTNNRTDARKTGVDLFFTITKSQKGQNEVKTRDKNATNFNFIKSDGNKIKNLSRSLIG